MHIATEFATPVGHKTLRLADLSPDKSPAFSPNLYRWMRRQAHFYQDGGVADGVYRVMPRTRAADMFGEGTLFIGFPMNGHLGDTDFLGARLMGVLCQGSREIRWAYPSLAQDVEQIGDFWDRYLEVGRCAIDPDHEEHFSCGTRFAVSGNERVCLWCGHRQHRVMTEKVVLAEAWVSD